MERLLIIIQFQNRKRWYCDCFHIAFYFSSRLFFSSYLVHLLHLLQPPFHYFSIINDFIYLSCSRIITNFQMNLSCFPFIFLEPWNIGFSTGRIAHHFIIWIAFVFADTMLWPETENGSFNYQFESNFIGGYRFVLCSHWFRHVSININKIHFPTFLLCLVNDLIWIFGTHLI